MKVVSWKLNRSWFLVYFLLRPRHIGLTVFFTRDRLCRSTQARLYIFGSSSSLYRETQMVWCRWMLKIFKLVFIADLFHVVRSTLWVRSEWGVPEVRFFFYLTILDFLSCLLPTLSLWRVLSLEEFVVYLLTYLVVGHVQNLCCFTHWRWHLGKVQKPKPGLTPGPGGSPDTGPAHPCHPVASHVQFSTIFFPAVVK
jgi:hypothetical protein